MSDLLLDIALVILGGILGAWLTLSLLAAAIWLRARRTERRWAAADDQAYAAYVEEYGQWRQVRRLLSDDGSVQALAFAAVGVVAAVCVLLAAIR